MPNQLSRSRRLQEWVPPKILDFARSRRSRSPVTARAGRTPEPTVSPAPDDIRPEDIRPVDPRWWELTQRTLDGLERCEPVYRPTNFWTPGVDRLVGAMETRGLERFKSWPEAFSWFYPTYGSRLTGTEIGRLVRAARRVRPGIKAGWLRTALSGLPDARRDFDAARLGWDQERWPFDLEANGESEVGQPLQRYPLAGPDGARWGKPHLNYLLCLAALSRHVTEPPRSFLELGGGFGSLGEIVLSNDPNARYVNLDIPPLLTVSSYYLSTLFGDDRVLTYDDRVADSGPVEVPASACLPNWRIRDIAGPFDVFVNSFSFQEMEPDVVEHYLDAVSGLGVRYVVSLNSRNGKALATSEREVGVKDQVTSARIITMLEARGYELCATYNRPLILGAGELAVLRRT
jgi:putative sugar O-methyltransferase